MSLGSQDYCAHVVFGVRVSSYCKFCGTILMAVIRNHSRVAKVNIKLDLAPVPNHG
jgi:hypothetical protein